ncbi:MAG: hypothetical protein AUK55_09865 [Syntrophobacteraceae bacterium CG2_30_61_12]|nr:MAG: hypothetical protein AUK55_09865 [Syntrophobacteraceae bacterium CG2_30_61_12]PIU32280.1 MAG: NAD-dependent succinate-semialdehyde dehydrogenase [Syntrophobacteraceae bacterium CG07_land_8_20_14_0_80_61_8]
MDRYVQQRRGCWIDGEERSGGDWVPVIDPATEQAFAAITVADRALVDEAVQGAVHAQESWKRVPAAERGALLHALGESIAGEQEALSSLMVEEVGKPLRAARAEVRSASRLCHYFAEEMLRLKGELLPGACRREQVLVVREPVGTVAAITPFNYPLSNLVCKLAPALAVGCTVVAKPDEHTSLTALLLARLAGAVGYPQGTVQVVTGPGPETGRFLVEHPLPRLVAFTGSAQVGREILALNAARVRKSVLELGGNCPAIVCEDADWAAVLPDLVEQTFKNSGQYCYRISRIYVARSLFEAFLDQFVKHAATLRLGPPGDPDTDLGPLNNPGVLARVRAQIEQLVNQGGRLLLDGRQAARPPLGYYLGPTVIDGARIDPEHTREEIFGPVVIISPVSGVAEAVARANATPYGLAAYWFGRDLGAALDHAGDLEVGSLWINRIHPAYSHAPFGGVKQSGLGREKSHFGLEEFTEPKTIYLSY